MPCIWSRTRIVPYRVHAKDGQPLEKKDQFIEASEHFDDVKALVLPAQMFRFGSERVAKRAAKIPDVKFSYSLQSLWPVNSQNTPKTEAEKTGHKFVAENNGKNYHAVEKLGGTQYFTAVAPVCVSCHNDHKDSPRCDFKIGEEMGGVVIRIPVDGCIHAAPCLADNPAYGVFEGTQLAQGRAVWLADCEGCHGYGVAGAPIPMHAD